MKNRAPLAQALLLLLLLAGAAFAQRGFDQPPPPAAARPVQLPPFSQSRLPNGVGIAVAERHELPLVTALLLIEAGSLLDPPGKAGLADLSVTLLSKGAQRAGRADAADAAEIAAAAEALGGSLETGTGARSSQIALTLTSNRLDEGLALLADLARAPTLPADELERSRAQTLDELKLALSDPGSLAALLARRLYWGDAPRGQVATPASLARIRREDVQAFVRQQLRPDRLTVVLAGDIAPAQAQALVARHFGGWKPNRMAAPQAAEVAPRPLAATALLVDLPGAGQSAVAVLAPYAPLGNAPEQRAQLAAGAVANTVLGVGYSSRINQEVRIKRGLSYGAMSAADALPGGASLLASAQTRHGGAAEVAVLLRSEVLRLAAEPVPAAELAARQQLLVGEFGRELETTATLAALTADQLMRGRALAELQQLPAELLAVNAARVRDFAALYWKPELLRTLVVGDLKEAGEGLRRQYPGAWVIPAGELDLGSPTLRRAARK
ncbi:MAG: pitrilysin family protein [Burkholderiaceae bacterium]